MKSPKLIDRKRFVDDRGILDAVFDKNATYVSKFSDLDILIKRAYLTTSRKGVIRGMHGHSKENKVLYVIKGAVKVVAVAMADTEDNCIEEFTLDEMKPQALFIPAGYYHGYVALTSEARIIVLSDKTLEESQKDDYREDPKLYAKHFEVKER